VLDSLQARVIGISTVLQGGRGVSRSEPSVRPSRVLVVDDDLEVRNVVRMALERLGCSVVDADSGDKALRVVEGSAIDLVVLDLGLPDMSGVEVLGRIRADSELPVIVLTARSSEPDRVLGLTLGADDYVAKPFSPRELAARVEAVLRRTRGGRRTTLEYGDLAIDLASHEVRVDGAVVGLTAREFELLRFLAESPRQVFTKAQLLNRVWNSAPGWQTEATVSEHVHRVRRKIEVDPKHPRRLVTVRGTGYRFDP
jgi:two-component system, OmpR family, phosphate regulon response regulator PhoB